MTHSKTLHKKTSSCGRGSGSDQDRPLERQVLSLGTLSDQDPSKRFSPATVHSRSLLSRRILVALLVALCFTGAHAPNPKPPKSKNDSGFFGGLWSFFSGGESEPNTPEVPLRRNSSVRPNVTMERLDTMVSNSERQGSSKANYRIGDPVNVQCKDGLHAAVIRLENYVRPDNGETYDFGVEYDDTPGEVSGVHSRYLRRTTGGVVMFFAMLMEAAPIICHLKLEEVKNHKLPPVMRDLKLRMWEAPRKSYLNGSDAPLRIVTAGTAAYNVGFPLGPADRVATQFAAIAASAILTHFRPSVFINAGTCGSWDTKKSGRRDIKIKHGQMFLPDKVMYSDRVIELGPEWFNYGMYGQEKCIELNYLGRLKAYLDGKIGDAPRDPISVESLFPHEDTPRQLFKVGKAVEHSLLCTGNSFIKAHNIEGQAGKKLMTRWVHTLTNKEVPLDTKTTHADLKRTLDNNFLVTEMEGASIVEVWKEHEFGQKSECKIILLKSTTDIINASSIPEELQKDDGSFNWDKAGPLISGSLCQTSLDTLMFLQNKGYHGLV